MTREQLLQSASELPQPSPEASREFTGQVDLIAAEINRRMRAREDLDTLIGRENRAMMEDNSHNFVRFMAALLRAYQANTLVDTALWAFRTYRAHGFSLAYWPAHLHTCIHVLQETLTADTRDQVHPFYEWLVVHVPVFAALTDAPPPGPGPASSTE